MGHYASEIGYPDDRPKEQPPPTMNDNPPIWPMVIEDMKGRNHEGFIRYGTVLQPNNGRDAMQDAYEEALDLSAYLKQAIVERNAKPKEERPVMATQVIYAVEFLSPGTFFHESSEKDIEAWDPKLAVEMAETIKEKHGPKPFGFRFKTYLTAEPIPDGYGGFLKVEERKLKESGTYFLGGRLMTLEEVLTRNDPSEQILASNMKGNGYPIVCVNTNSWKSVNPFGEKDFIVGPDGEVVARGDDSWKIAYRAKVAAEYEAEMAKYRQEKQ